MQRYGRSILICFKKLPSGHLDRFRVVVKTSEVESAARNYKSMGYKVVTG